MYQHNMTIEHRRGTLNEAPDALSRMHNVDVDPNGWEKVIEEAIESNIQLNSICDQNWYITKFNLVKTQLERFLEWKIVGKELFYYRPDFEKALIDDENPWKKVVKPDDIATVLRDSHDTPQAGHLGRDKTLDRIRQNFYWPGMTLDIKNYVDECETCVKVKYNQNPLKVKLSTRVLYSPWTQLSIDTVVTQTRTKKGNSCVLVVLDHYTKYLELFPVRARNGKTVVRILDTVFDRWGTPKVIITDNGKEFVNGEVASYLKARGVYQMTTPIKHPKANPVERFNRTIKPMIAAFLKTDHREWDENLSKLQLAYNTVPHSGTRVSPFFLNHGREAIIKHVVKDPIDKLSSADDSVSFLAARMKIIDEFRHKIESRLQQYNEKRLAIVNSGRSSTVDLKEGTEVYYPNKKLSNKPESYSAKLAYKYIGPAKIKRVLGSSTVELVDASGKTVGKYCISDLKIPRRSIRNV